MKKTLLSLFAVTCLAVTALGQAIVPSTPYTRDLLRSTDAAAARSKLGVSLVITNTDGIVQKPWTTNANADVARSGLNALSTTNAEWAIFGLAFDGGDGWVPSSPPTEQDQTARAVISEDGITWRGGTGFSTFKGEGGVVRDVSMLDLGDRYICGYTTNGVKSDGTIPFSTAGQFRSSTNLTDWGSVTNVPFALGGESGVSNYCWGPTLVQDGATIWCYVTYSTNGGASFEQRYRTTTTNAFPHGWTSTVKMNNGTGLTNILEITPYYWADAGIWLAWYKNETTKRTELGRFASGLDSQFTSILTGDHSGWNANTEGVWMVRLANGRYRVYTVRYQGKDYGNNGQGEMLCFAESTSPTNGWSTLTNTTTPFYFQNFKPIVVTSSRVKAHADAAVLRSSFPVKGWLNILPELGGPNYFYGFTFTNPWPAAPVTGIHTNDLAGIVFGNRMGPAIYGKGDGGLRMAVRSFVTADVNDAGKENLMDVATAQTNRWDFKVQPYYNGVALGGGGGISNPLYVTDGNVGLTLTNNGTANTPSLILHQANSSGFGASFGPFIRQRAMDLANGWSFGIIPRTGNKWILSQSDDPYWRYMNVMTNGAFGFGVNNDSPQAVLDARTNTTGMATAIRADGNVIVNGNLTVNGTLSGSALKTTINIGLAEMLTTSGSARLTGTVFPASFTSPLNAPRPIEAFPMSGTYSHPRWILPVEALAGKTNLQFSFVVGTTNAQTNLALQLGIDGQIGTNDVTQVYSVIQPDFGIPGDWWVTNIVWPSFTWPATNAVLTGYAGTAGETPNGSVFLISATLTAW